MADAPFIQQCMETPVTALTCLLLIVVRHPSTRSTKHPTPPHPNPIIIPSHPQQLGGIPPCPPHQPHQQIWFPLWNNRIGVDTVAFSYTRVVTHHEWWRVLSASHAHFDPFHLLFNIMALWCVCVRVCMSVLLGGAEGLGACFPFHKSIGRSIDGFMCPDRSPHPHPTQKQNHPNPTTPKSIRSCRPVEYMLGPSWIFFIQSLTFAVACKLIMIGVLHVASKQFPQQTRGCVSCVFMFWIYGGSGSGRSLTCFHDLT